MPDLLIWIVIIVSSILIGGACALKLKKRQALVSSALIPWAIFLVINLYGQYNSPDKEILQDTWVFFQLTIGSLISIIGLFSAVCVMKLSKYGVQIDVYLHTVSLN